MCHRVFHPIVRFLILATAFSTSPLAQAGLQLAVQTASDGEPNDRLGPAVEQVEADEAVIVGGDEAQITPFPENAAFKKVTVWAGRGDPVIISAVDAGHTLASPSDGIYPGYRKDSSNRPTTSDLKSRLVYSNVLSKFFFGPQGATATLRFADDITTTAVAGCPLDRFIIRVTGDRQLDGTGQGPYSVTTALHKACPGAGGAVIDGTQVTVEFPDNGLYELTVQIPPDVEIPLPQSLYLSAKFSRDQCGVGVGAPASLGFSMDRFDYPTFACLAGLGGFPNGPHASFYAQIFVREPCGEAFPAYKVSNQAGNAFTAGANVFFAQNIALGVPTCRLNAWEITHRGDGDIQADLRTQLSNADPANGFLIDGTRGNCFSTGTSAQVCRFQLTTPVDIPSNAFMIFRTTSTVTGPILTCRPAELGSTPNEYLAFNSATWSPHPGPSTCWQAFDITLYCEGRPPVGACCDMIVRDAGGEAVCRELPEMNCPFPTLWTEGGHCGHVCDGGDYDAQSCASNDDCPNGLCVGSFCFGGDNDDMPCTRAADCPNGSCDGGPFSHACGIAACCKPDDTCENMTRNECFAVEPVGAQRFYDRDHFCEDNACPFLGCASHTGPCMISHEQPGCHDTDCCHEVCEVDPGCCQVVWDAECVALAQQHCALDPENAECYSPIPELGAKELAVPSTVAVSNRQLTPREGPQFYCFSNDPEYPWCEGTEKTVWFKFRATDTSALISTSSTWSSRNTLVQVFRPLNSSTDQSSCVSLEAIACDEGSVGACAANLTPGELYYVAVGHEYVLDDLIQIDVTSPCTSAQSRLVNDDCSTAIQVGEGVVPIDMSGSLIQCPGEPCIDDFKGDIWYEWVAPRSHPALMTACAASAPSSLEVAVYEGCECPVSLENELECSTVQYDSTHYNCLYPAQVTFPAEAGQCYKIRVLGDGYGDPVGELSITTDTCPPADLSVWGPKPGTIDAQKVTPTNGIQSVASIPFIQMSKLCWTLCESSEHPELHPSYSPELAVNRVDRISVPQAYPLRNILHLLRPITPGEATTLVYTDEFGNRSSVTYYRLPGDVNGDGTSSPADILRLIDSLNHVWTAPWGSYSRDIDNNNYVDSQDISALIDLLNAGWVNVRLPESVPDCP